MKNKYLIILSAFLMLITACAADEEVVEEPEEQTISVLDSNKGDYSILIPFKSSPLRQSYASSFREVDMMEIGSRLQEKSKEHFDPKSYSLSEGSLIDRERYGELLNNQTDENSNGLNLEESEIQDGSVTITNPEFVSDIIEINFHKNKKIEKIDGVSIALVLKKVQVLDPEIGSTHKLSDDTLYDVGQTLGLRLYSYLSTLEGMNDVPIFIGLYVQESDVDRLPGKYLPGHYIGHAYFETRSDQFVRDKESWVLLNENEAMELIPEASSAFSRFRKSIHSFSNDENIGIVGKGFLVDDRLQMLQIELITGSKTYLEMYGLAQFVSQELSLFDNYQVPITVDIRIYQKSRIVVEKLPGKSSEIIEIH